MNARIEPVNEILRYSDNLNSRKTPKEQHRATSPQVLLWWPIQSVAWMKRLGHKVVRPGREGRREGGCLKTGVSMSTQPQR
jgi:hypothetical protein